MADDAKPADEKRGPADKPNGNPLVRARFAPNYHDMLRALGQRGMYRGLDPGDIARSIVEEELRRLARTKEYDGLLDFKSRLDEDKSPPSEPPQKEASSADAAGSS